MVDQPESLRVAIVYGELKMPTAESAKAFERLVEARNRLIEMTKRLNEAHSGSTGFSADSRSIQAEWNAAFQAFETATKDFTASVKTLRDQVEGTRKGS